MWVRGRCPLASPKRFVFPERRDRKEAFRRLAAPTVVSVITSSPDVQDLAAVPVVDGLGDEGGVVAHGEVVALCDGDLSGVGEAELPLGLEAERVVAFPEDREDRPGRKGADGVVDGGVSRKASRFVTGWSVT